MRIIFLTLKLNFKNGGGSAQELDTKMRATIKQGHTVSVLTINSKQNQLSENLPYKVREEYISSLRFFTIQKAVYKFLKKYESETDLFHVDGQFAYGSGVYRKNKDSKSVMVHFNRELSSFPESTRGKQRKSIKQSIRLFIERMCGFSYINLNDLLTFTSPYLRDVYVKYGVDKRKTEVIPDFFDSNEFRKNNFSNEANLSARKKNNLVCDIFCTGRMVSEKGFDVAIKAMSILLKESREYKLTISGDGPEKASLIKLSQELGISEYITFPGWLDKESLFSKMKCADILVIPRWRPELTSMISLESMALGIPTIVTKDTALSWQMQDSALTFDDEDYGELAKQIKKLRNDPGLREELVKKGWKRLQELDINSTTTKFISAISGVMKYRS